MTASPETPSSSTPDNEETVDLFIIGGGINGVGIARDAVGRGMSVTLAEMNDLASATSSASTKLFHGGLRYLEYFEIGLVRKALIEREVLLRAMPNISWPMRFILPYHKEMRFESETPTSKLLGIVMPWMKGRRPAWLIRLGLFLYDNLGGEKSCPRHAQLICERAQRVRRYTTVLKRPTSIPTVGSRMRGWLCSMPVTPKNAAHGS